MKKFKLIGLTGQSGAGKSTVAKIFADSGITVISADDIVHALYRSNTACVKTIAALFGAQALASDGTPDRKRLAACAFSSTENTKLLNSIVHPFVTEQLFRELRTAEGVVVYDAPQLFESGADIICDAVIGVIADREVRLSRIMARDGLSEEQATSRINAQFDEDFFKKNCDIIISNNGEREELKAQAVAFMHRLKA